MLKRTACIAPVILALILPFFTLSANAEYVYPASRAFENEDIRGIYYSHDDFVNELDSVSDSDVYFAIYTFKDSSAFGAYDFFTYMFDFQTTDYEAEIDSQGRYVITISSSVSSTKYQARRGTDLEYNINGSNIAYGNHYAFNGNYYIFDPVNGSLSAYQSNGTLNSEMSFDGAYQGFATNITEFDSSGMNVEVNFTPTLSGDISLVQHGNFIDIGSDDVQILYLDMEVKNNTNKNVIYNMTIYDLSDNIIYRYLSYEWCRGTDISTGQTIQPHNWYVKQLKGSAWHLVKPGESVSQKFNWSQFPLTVDTPYVVEVEACYNQGNTDFVQTVDSPGSTSETGGENLDITADPDVVYSSTFSISNFGIVTYNHDDDSRGVIPYQSEEDYARALLTRKASVDSDGNVDYTNYSAYDDPDSWYNTGSVAESWEARSRLNAEAKAGLRNVNSGSVFTNSNSSGFNIGGSASFGNLSTNYSGFFNVLGNVLGYFPSSVIQVFTFGMIAVIALGIIKAVIK